MEVRKSEEEVKGKNGVMGKDCLFTISEVRSLNVIYDIYSIYMIHKIYFINMTNDT